LILFLYCYFWENSGTRISFGMNKVPSYLILKHHILEKMWLLFISRTVSGRKLFGRNKIHWFLPERWQALVKVNHIGSTWQRINTQLLFLGKKKKEKKGTQSGWRDWGDGIKETVSVKQHDSSCGETHRVSPEQLHISFSSNSRGIRNSGFAVTDKMATMRPKPKQSMWASSPTECSGINGDTMWLNITSIFGIWKYLAFVKKWYRLAEIVWGIMRICTSAQAGGTRTTRQQETPGIVKQTVTALYRQNRCLTAVFVAYANTASLLWIMNHSTQTANKEGRPHQNHCCIWHILWHSPWQFWQNGPGSLLGFSVSGRSKSPSPARSLPGEYKKKRKKKWQQQEEHPGHYTTLSEGNICLWLMKTRGLSKGPTWLNLRVKATTLGAKLCFSFRFQPQLASSCEKKQKTNLVTKANDSQTTLGWLWVHAVHRERSGHAYVR